MTTDKLKGTNFELADGTVNFFGYSGSVLNNDTELVPRDARRVMARAVELGYSDQIIRLLVKPQAAVALFVEGVITREQLERATEGTAQGGSPCIDIPGVRVYDRALTVRVVEDTYMYDNICAAFTENDGVV